MTVAVVGIAKVARDLRFYYDQSIVAVRTPADLRKLKDNLIAEISLPLDVEKNFPVEFIISKDQFQLIPFQGTGYHLMWVVEGEATQRTLQSLRPPFKGRVVKKDFSDEWDVFGRRFKLQKVFAEDGIKLPENAMLLYDAPKTFPTPGLLILMVGAIAYVTWNASLFGRWAVRKISKAA